jgi:hypothetical protein
MAEMTEEVFYILKLSEDERASLSAVLSVINSNADVKSAITSAKGHYEVDFGRVSDIYNAI